MYDWISEIVVTDPWPVVRSEQMGRKAKDWLRSPDDGSLWLFKRTRVDEQGHPYGEDWAEVLAAAVAQRMGLPHAKIRLATRRGGAQTDRGVVVRHFSTSPDRSGAHQSVGRLQHGNELLAFRIPGYAADATGSVEGYTVANALRVLRPFGGHPDLRHTPLESAVEQFVAFLVFDALINATDRHHENWAVLSGTGLPFLTETYDHGACLGVPTPDHIREARLAGEAGGVPAWLARGRTRFEGRPRPIDVALEGLAQLEGEVVARVAGGEVPAGPGAADDIRQRVALVTDDWFREALSRLPDGLMSQVARTFACQIVHIAREELLDG